MPATSFAPKFELQFLRLTPATSFEAHVGHVIFLHIALPRPGAVCQRPKRNNYICVFDGTIASLRFQLRNVFGQLFLANTRTQSWQNKCVASHRQLHRPYHHMMFSRLATPCAAGPGRLRHVKCMRLEKTKAAKNYDLATFEALSDMALTTARGIVITSRSRDPLMDVEGC